jgi:outer membrane protein
MADGHASGSDMIMCFLDTQADRVGREPWLLCGIFPALPGSNIDESAREPTTERPFESKDMHARQASYAETAGSFSGLPQSRSKPVYAVLSTAWRQCERSCLILVLTLTLAAFVGCGSIHLNPDSELAPSEKAENAWTPPSSIEASNRPFTNLEQLRSFEQKGALQTSGGRTYDLPTLVDLALRLNPQTRHAWYVALEDEGQLGRSQANNYPMAQAEAEGGYFKLPLEFPGQTLNIRNNVFAPQFKVSYDLLDFGRTRADEEKAREELIAANFNFNQVIQDIVFNVERSFYVLAAAIADVSAAESNLKLANIALASVEERHKVGLATKPQVLLAKQVQAQAVYDLENANSQVHDAQASLRQTVGVPADTNLDVDAGQLDRLPKSLGDDVEALIAEAIKQRPDLAAQIAAVRAGDAAVERARAEYYPEISVGGNYGQVIWNYTVNGGHSQNLNQPFYGAGLTMRWDLFTGFDRYYAEQKARAEKGAALSELRSVQLNVIAGTWTAYYDFLSAKKKRDAAQALLSASEESYADNFESHRYGLATITDLITAERDVMSARYTLIQSKADLLISSCNLVHAIGASSRSSGSIP